MGNCCGARDDAAIKNKARAEASKWDAFLGSAQTDTEKFDAAYSANDVPALVALLNSKEPIDEPPERMHPWAANPRTVGTLAITQLAIMASSQAEGVKDEIREAGAIPILVESLDNTQEQDRLDAAVIALSFLSVENTKNCLEIYNSKGLPKLIKLMESEVEGMRGATAQTCRNVFMLGIAQKQEFVRLGGISSLIKLLQINKEVHDVNKLPEDALFNQLEAIYHLEDLLLDAGDEIPEFVQAVKDEGAVRLLEPLTKLDQSHKDVADAAQYLLVRLAD